MKTAKKALRSLMIAAVIACLLALVCFEAMGQEAMDLLLRPALFDAYGWFLTWFDTCDACETLDVTCGGTCIDTCDCEFDTLDITCECETWADDTCDCETEGCETLDCPATTDSPDCRTVDDTTCECYPTVGEDTCDGEDPECPTLNETCDEACAAG